MNHEIDTEIPDGAMVTAEIHVVAFLEEDGTSNYVIHTRGDSPMTTYLGLTVIAQDEIKRWSDEI